MDYGCTKSALCVCGFVLILQHALMKSFVPSASVHILYGHDTYAYIGKCICHTRIPKTENSNLNVLLHVIHIVYLKSFLPLRIYLPRVRIFLLCGVCVCVCACECMRGRSVIITVSIIIYTFVFFGFSRAKDVWLDYIRPGDMISDMHACSWTRPCNIVRFLKLIRIK